MYKEYRGCTHVKARSYKRHVLCVFGVFGVFDGRWPGLILGLLMIYLEVMSAG